MENNDPNDKKFRVISRNVNTINAKKGSLSWHAITQAALDVEADVLCLQETNINWSPEILQTARSILNKSNYRTTKTAYSVSSEATDGTYQPGGTMTSVLGRWTARTTNSGQDKSGLGRWSYVELTGRRNTRFIILSGYRVNPQRPKLGANTIYDQQYRLLLHKGQTQPNPRQQFVEDLTEQVKIWRKENVEVLLCLDTNEDVTKLSFKNSIGTLIAATDLKDLHAHQHPQWPRPATYQRGVNTIDICLASPGYVKALTKTFILPFHYPPTMPGDHRTIGVEFNSAVLFGYADLPPVRHFSIRGTNSNAQTKVTLYSKKVAYEWDRQNIQERLNELMQKASFSEDDHEELEQIDKDLTKIMVQADQQCAKYHNTPWSPILHDAYLEHKYWSLQLTSLKTKRNLDNVIQPIRERLKIDINDENHKKSIQSNMKRVQQKLREIKKKAEEHRTKFLNDLSVAAGAMKNKKRQKLIRHLKHAEENRRCFAIAKAHLKPHSPGGLTHILKQTGINTWETVDDHKEMEALLLNHSQDHFARAHGTDFTIEPLKSKLQYDGLTDFGEQITKGCIPEDIVLPKMTRLLLEHQSSKLRPGEDPTQPLEFEKLMQGFRKWKERTATSPSGRHLGIYKSLLKDLPKKEDKKQTKPVYRGIDVMHSIYALLQLAVKHTHTYE